MGLRVLSWNVQMRSWAMQVGASAWSLAAMAHGWALSTWQDIDSGGIREIVRSCSEYFARNPYLRWFGKLETLLRKSGRGFYDYAAGRPVKGSAGPLPAGLAARLVKPLLDRTQQLVDDGIVGDADLADAGVIFGTGFAPFTGGPLHYASGQRA